jgi:lipid II:glycine glycyltransferase (peptidoglycan interpeptide bridge formation enzyme)
MDEGFSTSKRYDVRSNLKKGLQPREVDLGRLDDFDHLMRDTYSRLQAEPTHQRRELEELIRRVPERIRLFLCSLGETEIAGILVFLLNQAVANTFYICERATHKKFCGPAVLLAHIMERMAGERVRYLDLGPSASDLHINEGVVFFKEGFAAQGFCRDTWRWQCR